MSGHVYVVAGFPGQTKIGFTANMRTRLPNLQKTHGFNCVVRFISSQRDDAHRVERIAHGLMSANRGHNGRDWYYCATEEAIGAVKGALAIADGGRRDAFNVRGWRNSNGLSVAGASDVLGKHTREITMWERGDTVPSASTRLLMTAIAEGWRPRPWPV